jgi:hypothetical protein
MASLPSLPPALDASANVDNDNYDPFDMSNDPDFNGADSPAEEVPKIEPAVAPARPPSNLSKLWLSLFAWAQHFRLSRAAFSALLVILAQFTWFLVVASNLDAATGAGTEHDIFPSLHRMEKYEGLSHKQDDQFFQKLVVCPKCMFVYMPNNVPKQCTFVRFPHHRQAQYRVECGAVLTETRGDSDSSCDAHPNSRSKKQPVPKLVFPYKSIRDRLGELFSTPAFFEQCERWRTRPRTEKHWSDVYDGSLWEDMQHDQGPYGDLLATPGNLALMLNLDWFNPFTRSQSHMFRGVDLFTVRELFLPYALIEPRCVAI